MSRGENGVGISRPPARPHYFGTNSDQKFVYSGLFTDIRSEYESFLAIRDQVRERSIRRI